MDHAKGLYGPLAVVGQARLDRRRIDAVAPVTRDEFDIEPKVLGHGTPQSGEVTGFEHDNPVARRQGINQGGFPGAGARRRVNDHRA